MSDIDEEKREEQRITRVQRRIRREERLARQLAAKLELVNDLIREHAQGNPTEPQLEAGTVVGNVIPAQRER